MNVTMGKINNFESIQNVSNIFVFNDRKNLTQFYVTRRNS